jgi:hypothetical protein
MSGLSDFTKAYNSVSDENNKIGPLIEAELKYLAAMTGVQGLPEGVEFVALMIGVNDGVNQAMANMLAALDRTLPCFDRKPLR